jgi:hypothetical protein
VDVLESNELKRFRTSEARAKPAVQTGTYRLAPIAQVLAGPVQIEPGSQDVAVSQLKSAERARILIIFAHPGKADSHILLPVTYCFVEPSYQPVSEYFSRPREKWG